ncbi:bifunctional diguanylate cyclase/phosphodiesterase [Veronia pacifica]|nr:EAL domain-containing protein [Veronia pacifica]
MLSVTIFILGINYLPSVDVFQYNSKAVEVTYSFQNNNNYILDKELIGNNSFSTYESLSPFRLQDSFNQLWLRIEIKNTLYEPINLVISSPQMNQHFLRMYSVTRQYVSGDVPTLNILEGVKEPNRYNDKTNNKVRKLTVDLKGGEYTSLYILVEAEKGFINPPLVREAFFDTISDTIIDNALVVTFTVFFLIAMQSIINLLWRKKLIHMYQLALTICFILMVESTYMADEPVIHSLVNIGYEHYQLFIFLLTLPIFILMSARHTYIRPVLKKVRFLLPSLFILSITVILLSYLVSESITVNVMLVSVLLASLSPLILSIYAKEAPIHFRLMIGLSALPMCLGIVMTSLLDHGLINYSIIADFAMIIGNTMTLLVLALLLALTAQQEQKQLVRELAHNNISELPNHALLELTISDLIKKDKQFSFFSFLIPNYTMVIPYLSQKEKQYYLKEVSNRLNTYLAEVGAFCIEMGPKKSQQRLGYISDGRIGFIITDKDPKSCQQAVAKVQSQMNGFLEVENILLSYQGSIGMSSFPKDGRDHETLINKSMLALSQNKTENKYRLFVFDPNFYHHNTMKSFLVRDIRQAIDNNELALYHQPQIDPSDNTVVGSEVLLRWNHFRHGFVSPEVIVRLAEELGIINDLTLWVVKHAFKHQKELMAVQNNHRISINITGSNVEQYQFVANVTALAERQGVDLSSVNLELTEETLVKNADSLNELIKQLASLGVQVSVDDYGTGYSSLNYLSNFSFSELKIDRSLIDGIIKNTRQKIIVEATIKLAKSLGLITVAEGVEDGETETLVKMMGIDIVQGYYYSKPLPFEQYLQFVDNFSKKSNESLSASSQNIS